MKFIIVIKGTTVDEYELIRQDITDQLKAMDMPPFLFARLPADYTEIEVVWIDEDMEKEQFSEALEEGIKSYPITKDVSQMKVSFDPYSTFDPMEVNIEKFMRP